MDHTTQIHSATSNDRKDDAMTTNSRRLMTTTTLRQLLPVRNRVRRSRRTVVSLALALVAASGITVGLTARAGAAGNGAPGSAPTLTLYIGTQGTDPGPKADLSTTPGVIPLSLHTVNLGFAHPITIGSASGGAGAGKASFNDLVATVPWDGSDAQIFNTLATGSQYPWAVLTVNTPAQMTGGSATFERYSFRIIFPTKLVNASDSDETQMTFVYAAVGIRTYTLTPSGGQGTPTTASWDQTTNSPDPTLP